MSRTVFCLSLLLFLLAALFLNPATTQAIGNADENLPSFADFSRSVQNGQADVLRGVYVPDVLALPVVQQPQDHPYYVSNRNGEITQFSIASQYGNVGLLAHNTLSGKFFAQLSVGKQIHLVYGNGNVETFIVADTLRFQASDPASISSLFHNLDRNETLSANEMFLRAYAGERHLVFQTCIEANGNPSWGRLFIMALPKE
ncbi:MAG TPA: hypothetical protein VFG81_14165 [Anaerolineales bacterium]|jgi:hypothetical protein|nr:hypothetical protein [Anaerolineales bacterium]